MLEILFFNVVICYGSKLFLHYVDMASNVTFTVNHASSRCFFFSSVSSQTSLRIFICRSMLRLSLCGEALVGYLVSPLFSQGVTFNHLQWYWTRMGTKVHLWPSLGGWSGKSNFSLFLSPYFV